MPDDALAIAGAATPAATMMALVDKAPGQPAYERHAMPQIINSAELCQGIIASGGVIANIGMHGVPVALHLERLWDRNVAITTRLADTSSTPMLRKILQSGKIDPKRLMPHHFRLDQILEAYETFGHAASAHA
jgi:alcohol dehydrogenase